MALRDTSLLLRLLEFLVVFSAPCQVEKEKERERDRECQDPSPSLGALGRDLAATAHWVFRAHASELSPHIVIEFDDPLCSRRERERKKERERKREREREKERKRERVIEEERESSLSQLSLT